MIKNSLKIAPYTKFSGGIRLEDKVYGKPGENSIADNGSKIDWRPNMPFAAELTFRTHTHDGKFYVEDELTRTFYCITSVDLSNALKVADVTKGKISGTWQVVKKHVSYTLAFISN